MSNSNLLIRGKQLVGQKFAGWADAQETILIDYYTIIEIEESSDDEKIEAICQYGNGDIVNKSLKDNIVTWEYLIERGKSKLQ